MTNYRPLWLVILVATLIAIVTHLLNPPHTFGDIVTLIALSASAIVYVLLLSGRLKAGESERENR
jgi:hypothetical protein